MNGEALSDWLALCRRLRAGGGCAAEGEALLARYGETHRAYHNFEHIKDCLAEFACARGLAQEADLVELAIWFHDAIYDPRRSDNEEQSADLARAFCKGTDLPPTTAERIATLILVTKFHLPGDDADARLLVDIDLSILGQPRDRFVGYEGAIRQEYSWVPDAAFREGRTALLREFLAREQIYSTPRFANRYEASARANLLWSLNRLAGVTGSEAEII